MNKLKLPIVPEQRDETEVKTTKGFYSFGSYRLVCRYTKPMTNPMILQVQNKDFTVA